MTLSELQSRLKAAGLVPILVTNATPDDERKRLLFSGSLGEYLEAAKALEARAVVVYSETLEEDDFLVESGAGEDADSDADSDAALVNLCDVDSKLLRFKDRIGEHGVFVLSIVVQDEHLDLGLEEPWWREFVDLRDEVMDRVANEQEERMEAARSRVEVAARAMLSKLHGLVDDKKFACLPTQKAMLQYALRKFPELQDLNPADLKTEIQELKARIDADLE